MMMGVIKNGAAGTDVVVKSSVGMGGKETTMTQNGAQARQKTAFLTGAGRDRQSDRRGAGKNRLPCD